MRHALLYIFLFMASSVCQAQLKSRTISVQEFLDILATHPSIAASAQSLTASQYEIEIAKTSPDPSITVGNVSGDISGINMPHQYFIGLDYTLETGGKRKQRVRYATSNRYFAHAQHEVFAHDFKRESLLLFQTCWIMEQRLHALTRYDSLLSLPVCDDSVSKLQLTILKEENILSRDILLHDYTENLAALAELLAHQLGDVHILPGEPVWNEHTATRELPLENHPSGKLIHAETELLNQEIRLNQVNRTGDISLTIGNNYITEATNPEAPSPHYNALTATLSIPLKFSNLKESNRKMDTYKFQQAQDNHAQAIDDLQKEFRDAAEDIQLLTAEIVRLQKLIAMEWRLIQSQPADENMIAIYSHYNSFVQRKWSRVEELCTKKSLFIHQPESYTKESKAIAGVPSK